MKKRKAPIKSQPKANKKDQRTQKSPPTAENNQSKIIQTTEPLRVLQTKNNEDLNPRPPN